MHPAAALVGAPCGDPSGAAEARAGAKLAEMSQGEKLSLVHGVLGAPWSGGPKPAGAVGSAGYVPGVPRLGIPALQETDGPLGVANPGNVRRGDTATAMPSNIALAATWDLALARRQGESVGAEAQAKGFNVLLGGAANLIRDPRGGRTFEYFSEDPLLTGLMAGAQIAGVQSRGVLSTAKHFALNDQETDRGRLDVRIDKAAARESDLLAFEIAIERGRPGAVMCAYNRVEGAHACESPWLLGDVLKGDWGYRGFVLSDWGAVHSTERPAIAGLDQESAEQADTAAFLRRARPRGRGRPGSAGARRRDGPAHPHVDVRLRPDGRPEAGRADRSSAPPRRPAPSPRRAWSSCGTTACCRSGRRSGARSSSARTPTRACRRGRLVAGDPVRRDRAASSPRGRTARWRSSRPRRSRRCGGACRRRGSITTTAATPNAPRGKPRAPTQSSCSPTST